jgi:hypothetical protein
VPLVRKPDARKSHIRFDERDLETEETVRYSDTDKPKGSETLTAEPNSTDENDSDEILTDHRPAVMPAPTGRNHASGSTATCAAAIFSCRA